MKKLKKLMSVLTFTIAVLCLSVFSSSAVKVVADDENIVIPFTDVTITNGSFNASGSNSGSLDSSPSGWSAAAIGSSTTKGVVNVDSSIFGNYYNSYNLESTQNPGQTGTDNKVLMINSATSTENSNTHSVIDYYTSNDINLASYSYYRVSVWVNTMPNSYASFIVNGLENADLKSDISDCYFSEIRTSTTKTYDAGTEKNNYHNDWQEYAFYISTNHETPTIQLKLGLGKIYEDASYGSIGSVYFDEVSMIKCSEAEFNKRIADENNASYYSQIEFNQYDVTPNTLKFDNFDDNFTFFDNNEETLTYENGLISTQSHAFGSDYSKNNSHAIYLAADENNAGFIGYNSSAIFIESNKNYQIAINVKSQDIEGKVFLKVIENDYIEKTYGIEGYEPKSAELSLTNTDTNQLQNDYVTYYFYVSGYELYDTEVYVQLSLGNAENASYGKVAFSKISVKEYPYSLVKSLATESTLQTLKLTSITGAPSFTNGYFNSAFAYDFKNTYPLKDDNWNITQENESYSKYGIVNVAKWNKIPTSIAVQNPLNPALYVNGTAYTRAEDSSNNIFMLYNSSLTYQTAKSPSFTLDANSYYTLSFNYFVVGHELLNIKVVDNENNIIYSDSGIGSVTSWDYYTITFKTEFTSSASFNLVFEVGTENNTKKGYAFFDDIQLEKQESLTAEGFDKLVEEEKNTVNLSALKFYLVGEKQNSVDIYEALGFEGELNAGNQPENSDPIAYAGLIKENNNLNIELPENCSSLLIIKNDAIANYSVTSKDTFSITSGNYYKISIDIKTFLSETCDCENANCGAYFELGNIELANKTHIISGSDFTTYSVYMYCDNDVSEITVKLGFTSDCIESVGYALFDNFVFETIDKAAFEKAQASDFNILLNETVVPEDENTEDENPEENGNASTQSSTFWIALSTIIMVLALVIAIVGGMLRKVKIKKFKTKRTTEYSRNMNIYRDSVVVEAEKLRSEEVKQLRNEISNIEKEIKELEIKHKSDIAEQRKISGKKITRKAEKEFKAYAATRQKLAKEIDRIELKIQDVMSEEHLMKLTKVIQSEKIEKELNKKDEPKANSEAQSTEQTTETQESAEQTKPQQDETKGSEN